MPPDQRDTLYGILAALVLAAIIQSILLVMRIEAP